MPVFNIKLACQLSSIKCAILLFSRICRQKVCIISMDCFSRVATNMTYPIWSGNRYCFHFLRVASYSEIIEQSKLLPDLRPKPSNPRQASYRPRMHSQSLSGIGIVLSAHQSYALLLSLNKKRPLTPSQNESGKKPFDV